MSFIDFDKNNYEARRILLNNILLEYKDNIVLEPYYSDYGYTAAAPYKFTLKTNRYRIEGYVGYKKDEVQYLLVKIYHMSWLGLLSDYQGSCVFSWEFPMLKLSEDMEQSKSYLRCVLKNKVSDKLREEKRRAEKVQEENLKKESEVTDEFLNYFNRNCFISE